MLDKPSDPISFSLTRRIGEKTLLLTDHFRDLDIHQTIRKLSEIAPADLIKLKTGAFGSLAFDIVFSPGIIPKKRETEYRQAYVNFFRDQYGIEVFDQDDFFVFQKEEDFYDPDSRLGPNEDNFLREWVANLRAIVIMLRRYRPMDNAESCVTNNLIEAALCRMAENGEEWPGELLYPLTYAMQERLETLHQEVSRELAEGRVLAPGQFFQIANELEFQEKEFLRGNINSRVNMVINQITGRQTYLPPEPHSGLRYDPKMDWHRPTPRQFRQVNLSAILNNLEQARAWTDLLLGNSKELKTATPLSEPGKNPNK